MWNFEMLECNSPSHKLVRSLEEISGVDVLVASDPGAVSIGRLYDEEIFRIFHIVDSGE